MRVELAAPAPLNGGESDAQPARKATCLSILHDSSESLPHQEKLRLGESPERSLSIRVDGDKRVVYQVIDERTGEVIRQIPPKEVRRAAHNIAELVRSAETGQRHELDIDT